MLQGASVVSHSGVLATASAFARTSAAGQIKITDAGVADFNPLTPSLFVDSATGAVAWLYEPKTGADATGIVTPGRTALTGLPADLLPPFPHATPIPINSGDSYSLSNPTPVYFGTNSMTRGGSSVNDSGPTITITWLDGAVIQPDLADPVSVLLDVDGLANVVMFRLHGTAQSGNDGFSDVWRPQCTSDVATGAGPTIELQECRIDQRHVISAGNIRMLNCATTFSSATCCFSIGQGSVTRFSGFSYSSITADAGGDVRIDGDFLIDGNGAVVTIDGSAVFIGNYARWGTVGFALFVELGTIHIQNIFEATHIIYGTVGVGNAVVQFTAHSQGGAIQYQGTGTAVATFQFDSVGPHWTFPVMGTSGFGFNPTTGVWTGPTTNTFAHLDAALGAGTGFGNQAVDPTTGNCFRSF